MPEKSNLRLLVEDAAGERRCQICIAGGGPAGMMLGLLVARSGIRVKVLEKHSDFFRDFRGDTIHPSTLEILDELGMLDEFLKLPHQEVRRLRGQIGDTTLTLADFTHLPVRCKFLAFMPQWDFLNFLAERACVYRGFQLEMESEVTGLTFDGERVTGVRVRTPAGVREVSADLVVGADGRESTVRAAAALPSIEFGAPMDVLWMRVSRKPSDPRQLLGRVDYGQIFVMIDRGDYWQCGLVVRKGALAEIQRRGLDALRADIQRLAPFLGDRVSDLRDWNDIKLLTVQVDRLRRWYRDGVLCIGDAAHAERCHQSPEANSVQKRREPRVRPQVVHERPCLEVCQPIGALLVGPVEAGKCLIPVGEPGVDQRDAKRRHILGARSLLETLQDLPRFAPLPCLRIGVAERGGRERQPPGESDGALQRADGFVVSGRR